jgi:glycosyltransferase involved in cell wall biosynthesis
VAQRRPSILFIQCPSVVLGLWAAILKQVFGFVLVADLHNEAVQPYEVTSPIYEALYRLIHRAADVCLVSNASLQRTVEGAGARAFVLPDKVPDLAPTAAPRAARSRRQAVFVCSYAKDEPYREVMEAARVLGSEVTIHITGDHRRVQHLPAESPVHLTGFLPEADYVALLSTADVIIDLTFIDDCLVCGAYEAVALGKPLVTSDTAALRDYFRMGTVYTKHDPQSLAAAITYALAHRERLAAEMDTLRRELARDWKQRSDALQRSLQLGDGDNER